jgi:hypothetical protein
MALPSSTLATYEAVGNREDLADIIYDVTPTETPYLSSIPKGSASSTKHEWLTRSLAAASGANAVLEGDDATTDAANANVRIYNYTQISDKVARITGTQESVDKAGMKSVMAREMSDKMKELKRDVETVLLQDVASAAGSDAVVRKCAGLSTFIKTNIDKDAGGTASAGTGTDTYTEGTARALAETQVEACLALAWTNGGNPTKGFLNAFQKRKFATFSGNATRTSNGDGKKVINSVDIYIDPLGNEVALVPCRHMPTDRIYFIDPDYVKFCPLQGRNFQSWDLAKTGDSMQKQILVEYTQEVCNEKAHAAVYDLTTS